MLNIIWANRLELDYIYGGWNIKPTMGLNNIHWRFLLTIVKKYILTVSMTYKSLNKLGRISSLEFPIFPNDGPFYSLVVKNIKPYALKKLT